MIRADKLEAVRRIVVHGPCSDGLASAMLLHDVLPDVPIEFVSYGTPEHKALVPEAGMLFADFSPPLTSATIDPEQRGRDIQAWRDVGCIVLDHHKTARDFVEGMGDEGIFGDEVSRPGICGATLVYEHVWRPLVWSPRPGRGGAFIDAPVARFANLAGIRDTWQRQSLLWNEACEQHAALAELPRDYLMSVSLEEVFDNELLAVGKYYRADHLRKAGEQTRRAYRFTTAKGSRVALLAGSGASISDVAEALDGPEQPDLVVGFSFRNQPGNAISLNVSLRSHAGYDCAALAAFYDGGGHTKAAGFTIHHTQSFEDGAPEVIVREVLDHWEGR